MPRAELEALERKLAEQNAEALKYQQERDALDAALRGALTDTLHGEVAAMNRENFIVRIHLEAVERFQDRGAWADLGEHDRETLQREVAGLPSEMATDDIESRLFDLTALRMQLARTEGADTTFERHRQRVIEIAALLEVKRTIPVVAAQLEYLAGLQENAFWEGIGLGALEDMRLRLRGLVPFLDRRTRTIVYTDFRDEVLGVREEHVVDVPKMTGAQYLNDRSLTAPQIRFIEMVIDQLTARGVMDAAALYEPPFSHLHAGGPDELFAGRENVIEGVFKAVEFLEPVKRSIAG